jgi:hypothetical protein
MMSTTITVAILVSLIIGLAFGSVIAGHCHDGTAVDETLGGLSTIA